MSLIDKFSKYRAEQTYETVINSGSEEKEIGTYRNTSQDILEHLADAWSIYKNQTSEIEGFEDTINKLFHMVLLADQDEDVYPVSRHCEIKDNALVRTKALWNMLYSHNFYSDEELRSFVYDNYGVSLPSEIQQTDIFIEETKHLIRLKKVPANTPFSKSGWAVYVMHALVLPTILEKL